MDPSHFKNITVLLSILLCMIAGTSPAAAQQFRGWDTNFTKKSIDLDELISGGPPKDGIPSIDDPAFISQTGG
jgi:hypothetical protein